MVKYLIIVFSIILAFAGCSRDDLCPEDTQTTPLLVIQFKNASNRLETKAVQSLQVLVNTQDSISVYASTETDTLVRVPLNTNTEITSFKFVRNYNSMTAMNTDTLTFTYTTEDLYLNRACSFRRVYNNFSDMLQIETEATNWILDTELLNTTIEDESEAHLTIFH